MFNTQVVINYILNAFVGINGSPSQRQLHGTQAKNLAMAAQMAVHGEGVVGTCLPMMNPKHRIEGGNAGLTHVPATTNTTMIIVVDILQRPFSS